MDIGRRWWTLDEARVLCESLEEVVSQCGFILSIYGSTVRYGSGRDLDMILTQKRVGVSPEAVCINIRRFLGSQITLGPEKSLFTDRVELQELPDGRLLDIQVRLSRNRMDALDLYESGVANC